MNVHTVIESCQKAIQSVLDSEKQQEVACLLPSLSNDLRRLIKQVRESRSNYWLWTDIYQMQPISEGTRAQQLTLELAQALGRPIDVFRGTADQVTQLRLQTQEAVNAWERVRSELGPQLSDFQREWEREVSKLRAVAEIPDLLEASERQAFHDLTERLMNYISQDFSGKSHDQIVEYTTEWQVLVEEFDQVKQKLSFEAIAETYRLSSETIEVLEELISGKRVSLDQISPYTLDELHRFKRFCQAVTLRFFIRS